MHKYKVICTWQFFHEFEIQASSEGEAQDKAIEMALDVDLDERGEYVEDSFQYTLYDREYRAIVNLQ